MSYGCSNTSVSAIGNGFVEVSWTESKVTLFDVDVNLSKKYIMIGNATTIIELPNGSFIGYLNNTPLLRGGDKFLISTAHLCEFYIAVHNISDKHGGRQFIHDGDWVIQLMLTKYLMYVSIQ